LAIVILGGLVSSTLLARIVTPVLYKLLAPTVEVKRPAPAANAPILDSDEGTVVLASAPVRAAGSIRPGGSTVASSQFPVAPPSRRSVLPHSNQHAAAPLSHAPP